MATPALLLALTLLAPAAAAGPPLAGCRAQPLADHGWKYACGPRTARTEDHVDGPPTSYLDGFESGVAATFGPGLVRREERRRLGGGGAEATLRVGTAADGLGGYAIALLQRPEGRRLVSCVTEDRRRAPCDELLSSLAGRPWRAGPAPGATREAPVPVSLAGRPVHLPKGCTAVTTAPGDATVQCAPPTVAGWLALATPSMEGEVRARFEAQFGQLDRPGLDFRRDAVPCRLAGQATTCVRLRVTDQGRPFVVLWAVAAAHGQPLAAFCLGPGGEPLPAPCSIPFALGAGPGPR